MIDIVESKLDASQGSRVSQRQKKPTNFEDLGFPEKEVKKRGRPST